MKTLRFTFIIALAALALTSCDFFKPIIIPTEWRTHYYFLHISLKDAAGNELIAPLAAEMYRSDTGKPWKGEINPEEYTLDLVLLKSADDSVKVNFTASKFNDDYSRVTPREDGTYGSEGRWFFDFRSIVINKTDDSYGSLKFNFTCPDVFGDDAVHEISTTWTKSIEANSNAFYPACTKVVLDGKEYTPVKGMTYYQDGTSVYIAYFIDVVLDR